MKRCIVLALGLALVLVGCGGQDVDPDLYQRVAHITDCNELGREAVTADAYHDRYADRGDLDRAKWANDYLAAIAKRMGEVGC